MTLKEYLEWEGMIRLRAYAETLLGSESEEAQGIVDEVLAKESLKRGGLPSVEPVFLFRQVKYRVLDFWRSKAMKIKQATHSVDALEPYKTGPAAHLPSSSLDETALKDSIKEKIGACPVKNALFEGYSKGYTTKELAKHCLDKGICSKSGFYRIKSEFSGLVWEVYARLGYPELIEKYSSKGVKING